MKHTIQQEITTEQTEDFINGVQGYIDAYGMKIAPACERVAEDYSVSYNTVLQAVREHFEI